MRIFTAILIGLAITTSQFALAQDSDSDFVKLKRAALSVPDLDRAIVFYRDVLGFKLTGQGELTVGPILVDLFNLESGKTLRRALFSSSVENNSLFIIEADDEAAYQTNAQLFSSLVIQTKDLAGVEARAKQRGFKLGTSKVDILAGGGEFRETVIFGPGGQTALVYEIIAK